MRIGFIVNDVKTEEGKFTTSRLGQAAVNRGHEVWVMGVGDLAYDPDDMVRARATSVPKTEVRQFRELHGGLAGQERRQASDHGRRTRRADAPQRAFGRLSVSVPGPATAASRIRATCHAARRDRVERSQRLGQGVQQDVLPTVSRRSPPTHADHPRPRRDQALREGGGHDRHQAAAGFGRCQRLPGAPGRHSEPEPDDRRGQPRRFCDCPGVSCPPPNRATCGCSS